MLCSIYYKGVEITIMEWIERLNQTIKYIEKHLTEQIDYDEIAKAMHCSTYYFQRMFTFMSDVPLAKYIRQRRMSLAAADLVRGEKIIDVSLKYGYTSPTAFNRAFQSVHGIAPSRAKESGIIIKSYPPMSFDLTIKGVEELYYKIEQKPAFRIVGLSKPLFKDLEQNFGIVPAMWDKAASNDILTKLLSLADQPPHCLLGISVCKDDEDWKYFIAVSSSASIDMQLEEYYIPSTTWAVFSGSGTNKTLQQLEKRVLTEWMITSGYEYANLPDIEVYLCADPQNAEYEYWLPIISKKE